MSYFNQHSSGHGNPMSNISESQTTGTSGPSESYQNGKGAIKKSNHACNKKPKDKFYRNNHRFKNNDNYPMSSYLDATAKEWKPLQQEYQNNYQSQNLANYGETNPIVNIRRPHQNYQRSKLYDQKYDGTSHNYYGKNGSYKNNLKPLHGERNMHTYDVHPHEEHGKFSNLGANQSEFEISNQNPRDSRRNLTYHHNKQPKINKNWRNNFKDQKLSKKVDVASQRERLEEMIKCRTLECLICCDIFKYSDKTWSCKQCYHIFHLTCTQAWANSSKIENGWRCPACQNVCKDIPHDYRCFCGKVKDPKNEPGLTPHSCGDVCLREGRVCAHRCLILCHPGPCPDCIILVKKSCGCGKTEQQVQCSSDIEIVCSDVCDKLLECGLHQCKDKCHIDKCKHCEDVLKQWCFCGEENREIGCTSEFKGKQYYSCGGICNKLLECQNHNCQEICHDGLCKPCCKDVNIVQTCFCQKSPLKTHRNSCLDPVPSCGLVCEKILKCGPLSAPHTCKSLCHDGDCPPCDLRTMLKCRCGFMDKEILCQELTTKSDDARCERKCTKKRLCGKHKCNQRCCIEIEHICPLPCNWLLSCGNHRCGLTCHSGRCKPCASVSFEELYCECGSSVLYPPVPCGTKPPPCDKPCARPIACHHEVSHTCHTGPCPPCTVLCKRWCFGHHEQRGTIPCHQENFSCGLPCGKQMMCGRHKCTKPCHSDSCSVPCKQPCTIERPLCSHPCGAPCHESSCPETSCKSKVPVTCLCGIQKGLRSCNEVRDEIRNIEMAALKEKMLNVSKNQSVDISNMSKIKRPDILKILECTEECRVIERNRRLAIGLQIRNPDVSQKLTPRYSDFMRGWAKKDPHFCQRVHDKLTELVQLAKQSKQKSRSYSFESMNRDKRHFVHEYCDHFGCDSAAYDAEPNRNIVATALKDKSWLPSMSLMEVIQRENGQRKVPGPSVLDKSTCAKSESIALKSLGKSVKLCSQITDSDSTKK